jgi:hypothetical protein
MALELEGRRESILHRFTEEGSLVKQLSALILISSMAMITATAQTPQSNGKTTEKVIVRYEQFVASGAFLTPDGWEKAGNIFNRSGPFPRDGEISLMTTGGSLGENWVKGDQAEVETKWTNYLGTIDSSLRYERPKNDFPVTMTVYEFRLVYTNKHTELAADGKTIREITGAWEWKIEDPPISRWTTVDRAIEYVSAMSDKSNSPLIKKNAKKTVAALKRLRIGCGSASAC